MANLDMRLVDAMRARATAVLPDLADTIPPTEPPTPAILAQPRQHRVIAWRHDGGMADTKHATLELARAFADTLHYAVFWKFAILCGREIVDRRLIEEPVS